MERTIQENLRCIMLVNYGGQTVLPEANKKDVAGNMLSWYAG